MIAQTMQSKSPIASGSAALRFDRLMRNVGLTTPLPVDQQPCLLRIDQGVHAGAQMRLQRSPVTIGSAPGNDIVLQDAGVLAHHAELRRVDGVWYLFAVSGTDPFPPLAQSVRGYFHRQRHGLGATGLVISQRQRNHPKMLALVIGWRRAVAPVLFVMAAAVGAGVFIQLVKPAQANMAVGERNLTREGWPDVRLVVNAQKSVQVLGYVDDAAALAGLQQWLKANNFDAAEVKVRSGTELVARIKGLLGEEHGLQIDYTQGGRVRIQGSSNDLALSTQIKRLASDLAPVVKVDDLVVYSERPEPPKVRPLPVRITSISPGENGSFTTEAGGRYFVGAVLSDGAEVISIKPDGVEFKIGDKNIIYPLN